MFVSVILNVFIDSVLPCILKANSKGANIFDR